MPPEPADPARRQPVRGTGAPLHVRWLGSVAYEDAWAFQRGLHADPLGRGGDHLLLLQHPHTFTLGRNAESGHVLVDPASVGARLINVDRGGDVTYHGPGQLVAYPILTLPDVAMPAAALTDGAMPDVALSAGALSANALPDGAIPAGALPDGARPDGTGVSQAETRVSSKAYVSMLEEVLIETLKRLGVRDVGRHSGYPGVWVAPNTPVARKIAAIGVRIAKSSSGLRRTLHGIALNVDPDLSYFERIIPCGIEQFGVTSIAAELSAGPRSVDADDQTAEAVPDAPPATAGSVPSMRTAVDTFAEVFAEIWKPSDVDRQDVVWRGSGIGGRSAEIPNGDIADRAGSNGDAAGTSDTSDSFDSDLAPFSRGMGPGVPTHGANEPRRGGAVAGRAEHEEGTSVRLLGRLAQAGVNGGVPIAERKPDWMRARVRIDSEVLRLKHTVRDLGLITVCEEAGCPNLSECWSDGTATFMVCGERCTRACGFCLVDTRHPEALDPSEPGRVAEAVHRMGVDFAVVTMVARDDLQDGGSAHIAQTIRSIRELNPGTRVEVLISDMKGDPESLQRVFDERPDVLNHNVETVPRLQRAVRPSASYARSLGVLSRAAEAGLVVKSGLVVGMGETEDEIDSTLADLAAVGASIVTIGQYLRPTSHHLPVASWWTPDDFGRFKRTGEALGIGHVESSPFTRSSYHAKRSFESDRTPPSGTESDDPLQRNREVS